MDVGGSWSAPSCRELQWVGYSAWAGFFAALISYAVAVHVFRLPTAKARWLAVIVGAVVAVFAWALLLTCRDA